MKFSKKLVASLLMSLSAVTTLGVVHQAQAAHTGSGVGGLWSGAVRNNVPSTDPYTGNLVWSTIVTFVASSESACQAQMQPYLDSGATLVRPCQKGMVNLDNVSK